MVKLKLVLDSNEYVFYFDNKSSDMLKLLDSQEIKFFLTDLIIQEVLRNIRKESIKDFFNILKNPRFEVVTEGIPNDLIDKYKKFGLKKGDIVIAAFCETINTDYLVTENRHFLKSKKFDNFEVLSLKEFLKKLSYKF